MQAWAARMQGLGVAPPPLARRKLTADGLAHVLRAACDNEWLTDNAARLGEQLRNDLAERRDPVEIML